MGEFDDVVLQPMNSQAHSTADSDSLPDEVSIIGPQSPGARRTKIVANNLTDFEFWSIIVSLFILGWAYGLESLLRGVYQPYATSSFSNHSTLATVNVLRNVVTAATYPMAARIADVFGRVQMLVISIILYTLGTTVDAVCKNVEGYSAGAVIYQIGYTSVLLLVEVIVADITPPKKRLVFSYVPTLPFLVNTWISGNVSEEALAKRGWRIAVGMWAGIICVASLPLFFSLYLPHRRTKKQGLLKDHPSLVQKVGRKNLIKALLWQLDVFGSMLLVAVFALILVPFTIAGRAPDQWKEAKVITPLVLGLVCIPFWLFWEAKCAKLPLLPLQLLKDRAIWGSLGIAWMLNFCWSLQNNYLYTVLIVAFDESVKSAARINSLYSFCSVLTGFSLGLLVALRIRYLQPFIITGACLFLAAFGVLFHYRGGADTPSHSGIIGAQIFLGFAGGLVPFPTQTLIQVATKHEHVAFITGLYLSIFNIGSAFGNAVSGAIWSQTLVPTLLRHLPAPYNTEEIANQIFDDPFKFAEIYSVSTPMRSAIIISYRHTQKMLMITGAGLCVPLIVFTLCIRNPRLGNNQSSNSSESPVVRVTQAGGQDRWKRLMFWR